MSPLLGGGLVTLCDPISHMSSCSSVASSQTAIPLLVYFTKLLVSESRCYGNNFPFTRSCGGGQQDNARSLVMVPV